MIEKAAAAGADEVIIDLEDACAPAEKASARRRTIEALNGLDFGRSLCAVRVNGVDTAWCHADVVELVTGAAERLDAIVVPKVENVSHVHFLDHLVTALEVELRPRQTIGLELLVESPRGAVCISDTAPASPRVSALLFGPGDYATAMGVGGATIGAIDPRYRGHQWHWVMSQLAASAHANGLQAIDGPYGHLADREGFCESATLSRLLGFSGKWCIHPRQVPWANEMFSPTEIEIGQARRIVEAYEEALAQGRGAIQLNGMMIDEASRKAAEIVLARSMSA